MQTQHIVSFYHVARLRSITKAANAQGLAQPTVTSHLKKLEEELGVSLFDRIKRPIMLTSNGVAVWNHDNVQIFEVFIVISVPFV